MIEILKFIEEIISVLSVVVIIFGLIFAFIEAGVTLFLENKDAYRLLREKIGKSILLGLELLIVSDIISSIANPVTLESILLLGLIILIRVLISVVLEREIRGLWPFDRARTTQISNSEPDRSSE